MTNSGLRSLLVLLLLVAMPARECRAQAWPIVGDPISENDLADYALWLDLDDGQIGVMRAIYQDYRTAIAGIADARDEAVDLRHKTMAAYGALSPIYDIGVSAMKATTAYEAQRNLIEDASFWNPLRAFLPADRSPQLDAVQNARLRWSLMCYTEGIPLEGKVDIAAILVPVSDETQQSDRDRMRVFLPNDEWRLIEPTIRAWDASVISILQEHYRALRSIAELRFAALDLGAFLAREADSIPEAERVGFRAEMRRMGVEMRQAQATGCLALPRLNRRTMETIRAALPAPKGRALLEIYLELADPEIWPDPADAYLLFAKAMSLPDLTIEQAEAIDVLAIAYRENHDRLTMRLCDIRLERETTGLTGRATGTIGWEVRVPELDTEADKVGLRREKLDFEQRPALALVLSPEQLALIPELARDRLIRPWAATELAKHGATTKRDRRRNDP